MNIQFETRGKTYFRNESSLMFNIDGDDYWFTMIEEGDTDTAPHDNTVEFIPDDELPFELTEEMKDEMYEIVSISD